MVKIVVKAGFAVRKLIPGDRETLARMTASARQAPEIWRLVLGIVAAFFTAFVLLIVIVLGAGILLAPFLPGRDLSAIADIAAPDTQPVPVSTFILLISFIALIIGAKVAAKIHRRSLKSLCGIGDGLRPRALGLGLGVVLIFTALSSLAGGGFSGLTQNIPLATWGMWLVPALFAIFIQTFAEELIFRGYLQQQLTAISINPLVWWILPSVIFGLFHLDFETFGENSWLIAGATTLMALIAADVTARTGNISGALGLHFGNNIMAILLVATPGPLAGLSLYLSPVSPSDTELMRASIIATIIPMIFAYAIYLFVVTRPGKAAD